MSNIVLSHSGRPSPLGLAGTGPFVAAFLAVWLALVFWYGASGAFVATRGAPPLALLISGAAPVILFLAAFRLSRGFRDFVLAADPRLMAVVQSWRIGGFAFLALYANGVLPGYFAWPAGLGDIAVGMTAPLVVAALIRRPAFAAGKTFAAWNVLGILDLVVAVGAGALGSFRFADVAGAVTTAPMAHLPLVLVPAYFVPAFIILHLTALFQARRLNGSLGGRA